jgi:hypothetical protein
MFLISFAHQEPSLPVIPAGHFLSTQTTIFTKNSFKKGTLAGYLKKLLKGSSE